MATVALRHSCFKIRASNPSDAVTGSADADSRVTGSLSQVARPPIRSAGRVADCTPAVSRRSDAVIRSAGAGSRVAGSLSQVARPPIRSTGRVADRTPTVWRRSDAVIRSAGAGSRVAGSLSQAARPPIRSAGRVADRTSAVSHRSDNMLRSAGTVPGLPARSPKSRDRRSETPDRVADPALPVSHRPGPPPGRAIPVPVRRVPVPHRAGPAVVCPGASLEPSMIAFGLREPVRDISEPGHAALDPAPSRRRAPEQRPAHGAVGLRPVDDVEANGGRDVCLTRCLAAPDPEVQRSVERPC